MSEQVDVNDSARNSVKCFMTVSGLCVPDLSCFMMSLWMGWAERTLSDTYSMTVPSACMARVMSGSLSANERLVSKVNV